jgi:hypothetical protein
MRIALENPEHPDLHGLLRLAFQTQKGSAGDLDEELVTVER